MKLLRSLPLVALVLFCLIQTVSAQSLAIKQTVFPAKAIINNPVTFTVTITNTGKKNATKVVVTDQFPARSKFVSASPKPSSRSGSTLTFALGTIAAGKKITLRITVKPTAVANISNIARVNSAQLTAKSALAMNNPITQKVRVVSALGTNLVRNPGAEAAEGSEDGEIVPVPEWDTNRSGTFTTVKYNQSTYPGDGDDLPASRGNNFFAGGMGGEISTGSQEIDVSDAAVDIARGNVSCALSAYLGGFAEQEDSVTLTASFLDGSADENVLSTVLLGPVTSGDRGQNTALLFRSANIIVPANTRKISLVLRMVRQAGSSNDGYADNISLVLTPGASNTLHLTMPTSLAEGDGTRTGTISRTGSTASALVVNLNANVSNQLTLPASVNIPANSASAPFSFTVVDDVVFEPSPSTVVVTAAATSYTPASMTVAITDDDPAGAPLVAWGSSEFGQIGDGTRQDRPLPVPVSLNNVTSAAANGSHSLAVLSNGTVRAWGYNGGGQLGDGTTTDRHSPVVVSGLNNVRSVAAGWYHSLAVRGDGTVWAWGYNNFGQLGDGTRTRRLRPVQVATLTGVRSVAAGIYFSLAVKNDGTVWAWGNNFYGQLGDNRPGTDSLVPRRITTLSNITAAAAGAGHSLFLRGNGQVFACGWNAYGQLGDNSTNDRALPFAVPNVSGATAVSAGYVHSLALRSNGGVTGWGNNSYGQLGNGSTGNSNVRANLTFPARARAIAAGSNFSAFALENDQIVTTGDNVSGQLGRGNFGGRAVTPQAISGVANTGDLCAAYGHGLSVATAILGAAKKPSGKSF